MKTNVIWIFKIGIFTSFLLLEVLGAPRTIFHYYHRGTIMSFARQNPRRLFILDCVTTGSMKPEAEEWGVLKQIIWTLFIVASE